MTHGGPLPPAYVIAGTGLMLVLHWLAPICTIVFGSWRLLGLLPFFVGCGLNIAADRAFKRHQTTVKPFEVSSYLVTDGVFAWTRQPMYLGMVLILFGFAVFLGTISPFAVPIALGPLLHYRFVVVEERMLAERFGTAWDAYRSKVRRWV